MEIPDISRTRRPRPAHSGAPHGRTFPVRIDDDHVLLHEQRPSGEDLLVPSTSGLAPTN